MARPIAGQTSLQQLFADAGIHEDISAALIGLGYNTAARFHYAFQSQTDLHVLIRRILVTDGIGTPHGVTDANVDIHPMAADIRRAWWDSWYTGQGAYQADPVQVGGAPSIGWHDKPPPRSMPKVERALATFKTDDQDESPTYSSWCALRAPGN